MMAQQVAMQQQANAQGQGASNQQGQPNQMNPQQLQNMQAQANMMQQAHQQQQQQQQQQAAAASQQAQGQAQAQAQPQQATPNTQAPSQQAQQAPQQQASMQQAQQAQQQQANAMLQQQAQQRQGEKFKGQCLMKLMQFGDHLSGFGASSKPLDAYMANGAQRLAAQGSKQADDLNYWINFRDRFFSPKGVLRHSVWLVDETSNKQYEITFPALARYFHTHFESGIKNMQMIIEKGTEKELPNSGHYIESGKSSFVYWFDNGSQVSFVTCYFTHFNNKNSWLPMVP
jgi:LIM-domain binding protein